MQTPQMPPPPPTFSAAQGGAQPGLVRRRHHFDPRPWGLPLLFALGLLALAIPSVLASFFAFSPAHLARKVSENQMEQQVAQEDLLAAITRLQTARWFAPHDRQIKNAEITLALRRYGLLYAQKRFAEANHVLRETARLLESALADGPGDANLWYLLAELRSRLMGMGEKTLAALALSYLTGPRAGWIAERRLGFSLKFWLFLDPDLRRYVRREIRTLWREGLYQRVLAKHFATTTLRGRKVIAEELASLDPEAPAQLAKMARAHGWRGNIGQVLTRSPTN